MWSKNFYTLSIFRLDVLCQLISIVPQIFSKISSPLKSKIILNKSVIYIILSLEWGVF